MEFLLRNLIHCLFDDARHHPSDLSDQMHQVPGVGVVVVDHDDTHLRPHCSTASLRGVIKERHDQSLQERIAVFGEDRLSMELDAPVVLSSDHVDVAGGFITIDPHPFGQCGVGSTPDEGVVEADSLGPLVKGDLSLSALEDDVFVADWQSQLLTQHLVPQTNGQEGLPR